MSSVLTDITVSQDLFLEEGFSVMPLTAQDHEDIRQLLARYNFAIDLGDVAGWVSTFTTDGVFECLGLPASAASRWATCRHRPIVEICRKAFRNQQGSSSALELEPCS